MHGYFHGFGTINTPLEKRPEILQSDGEELRQSRLWVLDRSCPQADLAAARKPSGTSLADGGKMVQSMVSKKSLKAWQRHGL